MGSKPGYYSQGIFSRRHLEENKSKQEKLGFEKKSRLGSIVGTESTKLWIKGGEKN